jgi:uncharacterized damage-inducible protein DinB
MTFSESLLPEFDEEMKNTRKLLECVPDDKFGFQPHAKSMTMARLASHVAELPSWASFTLDTEVLEMHPGDKPVIASSRAELLDMFDKCVPAARAKIAAATQADWAKTWTFKYDGKTVLAMPRAAVMRSVIMNHLIHHRAQLGVFLRLNDVEIPGMYGPSADEMKFWEAKSA